MKVSDLFETNEWENHSQKTLPYLYRVQAARCHEYWVYLMQIGQAKMNKKSLIGVWGWEQLSDLQNLISLSRTASPLEWDEVRIPESLSGKELQTYKIKYWRMMDAKRAYQVAGGRSEGNKYV